MKIVHVETLISCGEFVKSAEWVKVRKHLDKSIQAVDWPVGSGKFTIYPEKHGNGVKPIKNELVLEAIRK